MGEVKWIKVSTDMFNNNRKIKQIELMPKGDAIIVIWFKLMLLAGNINDGGAIYLTPEIPYTDEELANELRKPIATVKSALSTFQRYGMIDRVDGFITLTSWEKYQSADKLAEIRAKDRERKRLKKTQKEPNSTEFPRNFHGQSEHIPDTDIEVEKEKEKDIYTTTTTSEGATVIPNLTEVYLYMRDCCDGDVLSEAEKFHAYNANRGWDCLPDWRTTADLWIARIQKHNK